MQPETNEARPKPARRRWPVLIGAGLLLLLAASGVGFTAVTTLEEHDSFCVSCHVVPERVYFNRAYFALDNPKEPVTDLATAHYTAARQKNQPDFKCIDCHRGDSSLGQRIATVALGGRDTAIFALGQENPALEKLKIREPWLPNASCVHCHADTLLMLKGIDNHFHTYLPQAAEALAKGGVLRIESAQVAPQESSVQNAKGGLQNGRLRTFNVPLTCTDCHQGHRTFPSGATQFFMDATARNEACVVCHIIAKEGPQDPKSIGGG